MQTQFPIHTGIPGLLLRKAVSSDLSILQFWDQQEHVKASDPNDDWNWEQELLEDRSWQLQLIASFGGRPIGFLQIIDPQADPSNYWGEIGPNHRAIDIWIGEKEFLGRGFGSAMMTAAINICFGNPSIEKILIDPLDNNVKACRFYEKIGFEFLEKKYFGKDYCRVYQLLRKDWQAKSSKKH